MPFRQAPVRLATRRHGAVSGQVTFPPDAPRGGFPVAKGLREALMSDDPLSPSC